MIFQDMNKNSMNFHEKWELGRELEQNMNPEIWGLAITYLPQEFCEECCLLYLNRTSHNKKRKIQPKQDLYYGFRDEL